MFKIISIEKKLREFGVLAGVPVVEVVFGLNGNEYSERKFIELLNEKIHETSIMAVSFRILDIRGFDMPTDRIVKVLRSTNKPFEFVFVENPFGKQSFVSGIGYWVGRLKNNLITTFESGFNMDKGLLKVGFNLDFVRALNSNRHDFWIVAKVRSKEYVRQLDLFSKREKIYKHRFFIVPADSLVRQRKTKQIKDVCLEYGFRYGIKI